MPKQLLKNHLSKSCKNCYYAFKLSNHGTEYYCQGSGQRFADIVEGDSVCEHWESEQQRNPLQLRKTIVSG